VRLFICHALLSRAPGAAPVTGLHARKTADEMRDYITPGRRRSGDRSTSSTP